KCLKPSAIWIQESFMLMREQPVQKFICHLAGQREPETVTVIQGCRRAMCLRSGKQCTLISAVSYSGRKVMWNSGNQRAMKDGSDENRCTWCRIDGERSCARFSHK